MTNATVEMEEVDATERRLEHVKKKSSQQLAQKPNSIQSAYMIRDGVSPYSFCSQTISRNNRFVWKLYFLGCLLVVFVMFTGSYLTAFAANKTMNDVFIGIDILYIYIMLVRSKTAVIIDGFEERDPLKIRSQVNVSIWFLIDIITFIPLRELRWHIDGSTEKLYAAENLLKSVRLHFVLYCIGTRVDEPGSSTLLYSTIKYALLSTLTIHFTACGWYALACSRTSDSPFNLELCEDGSWFTRLTQGTDKKTMRPIGKSNEINPTEEMFPFIMSLYWATATATSTGYGDVYAYTEQEKVFSIFAMSFGLIILYGMTMGGITSMLTNVDGRRSSFVHTYQSFQQEVERMGLTNNVKNLCLRYYDYLWHRWEGQDIHATGVLEILPEPLRASFAKAIFDSRLIAKADLLADMDEAFCRNLALVMRATVFLENQFAQKSGEIDGNMCFIQTGDVEVLNTDEETVMAVIHSGKLFGQIMLVFDLPRFNSVRCKTNCDIFTLNKHDFRQVLSDHPEAARKFIDAVRRKCESKEWPMDSPNFEDFALFVEKTKASKQRKVRSLAAGARDTTAPRPPMKTTRRSTRRLTTVYSTDYEGVDLSRAWRSSSISSDDSKLLPGGRLGSYNPPALTGKKIVTMLQDGTELIAGYSNHSDLKDAVGSSAKFREFDTTTWEQRWHRRTLIDPKGRFYGAWTNYMSLISYASGIYTLFMVAFVTTPGKDFARDVQLLPIAKESLYG